jgi:hypothetical protein
MQVMNTVLLVVIQGTLLAGCVGLMASSLSRRLHVIHALVNSNMTAHMQSELDATVRELAMMREVARLHEDAGRDPTEETITAIELTEHKVAELRAVLRDRFKAQDAA